MEQCLAETPWTVDSDSGHVQSCVACSLAQLCVGWSSRSQLSVGVGGGWHSCSQLSWTKISPVWTWCCLWFCSLQISKSGVRTHHSDGKKIFLSFSTSTTNESLASHIPWIRISPQTFLFQNFSSMWSKKRENIRLIGLTCQFRKRHPAGGMR